MRNAVYVAESHELTTILQSGRIHQLDAFLQRESIDVRQQFSNGKHAGASPLHLAAARSDQRFCAPPLGSSR